MLQGGRVAQYDETELAILEASVAMDEEYVAVGSPLTIYGEVHLDVTSLCGIHHGLFV